MSKINFTTGKSVTSFADRYVNDPVWDDLYGQKLDHKAEYKVEILLHELPLSAIEKIDLQKDIYLYKNGLEVGTVDNVNISQSRKGPISTGLGSSFVGAWHEKVIVKLIATVSYDCLADIYNDFVLAMGNTPERVFMLYVSSVSILENSKNYISDIAKKKLAQLNLLQPKPKNIHTTALNQPKLNGTHCVMIGGTANTIESGEQITMINCHDCTAEGENILLINCEDIEVYENNVTYISNTTIEMDSDSASELVQKWIEGLMGETK